MEPTEDDQDLPLLLSQQHNMTANATTLEPFSQQINNTRGSLQVNPPTEYRTSTFNHALSSSSSYIPLTSTSIPHSIHSENSTTEADSTTTTDQTTTLDVWADTISRFDNNTMSTTSIISFSLSAILMAGSLLLLFAVRGRTLRYTSMIRITVLINIVLTSISDIMVGVPAKSSKERNQQTLCVVSNLLADFWVILMLLMLPLLCAENLLKKRSKWIASERQKRNLIGSLLVAVYTFAVIFSCLPLMVVGQYDQKNRKCDGQIQYGHYFAYVYLFLTAAMLLLIVIFGSLMRSQLKTRLTSKTGISDKRKLKLKLHYHNTVTLTAMLCLGLVPHSITRQQTLFCGSRDLNKMNYCTDTLPFIFYRLSYLLMKSVYVFMPMMYLGLDYKLRSKYWVVCGSATEETIGEESVQTSNALVPVNAPNYRHITLEEDFESEPVDFSLLAITDGRSDIDRNSVDSRPSTSGLSAINRSGSSQSRDSRRNSSFRKKRKRISENVDVLSIISERSESSRTSSERASFRANYTNQAFDWSALRSVGVTSPSIPRSIVQPRLIRRTTSYTWIATAINDAYDDDEDQPTGSHGLRQRNRLAITDGQTGTAIAEVEPLNYDLDDLD